MTEPDMRARIRLFGLIDQNASESWLDTCGWLISPFTHQTVIFFSCAIAGAAA
jgi:hypothetical protein